jgi:hypothetical protein
MALSNNDHVSGWGNRDELIARRGKIMRVDLSGLSARVRGAFHSSKTEQQLQQHWFKIQLFFSKRRSKAENLNLSVRRYIQGKAVG